MRIVNAAGDSQGPPDLNIANPVSGARLAEVSGTQKVFLLPSKFALHLQNIALLHCRAAIATRYIVFRLHCRVLCLLSWMPQIITHIEPWEASKVGHLCASMRRRS